MVDVAHVSLRRTAGDEQPSLYDAHRIALREDEEKNIFLACGQLVAPRHLSTSVGQLLFSNHGCRIGFSRKKVAPHRLESSRSENEIYTERDGVVAADHAGCFECGTCLVACKSKALN